MLVVLEQVDDEQHLMDVVPLFVALVDYLLGHVCDHVVDREPGLCHLAAGSILVVFEQVDEEQVEDNDDEQHLMDVVPLSVVLGHVVDKLLVFLLLEQGNIHLSFFVHYHLM
jgi:hypothetical protein